MLDALLQNGYILSCPLMGRFTPIKTHLQIAETLPIQCLRERCTLAQVLGHVSANTPSTFVKKKYEIDDPIAMTSLCRSKAKMENKRESIVYAIYCTSILKLLVALTKW